MAFLLFVDESGQDQRDSPYEVLAGLAVEDSRTWNLITAIQSAEVEFFGRRITHGVLELKAKKLLKRKVFRHAAQCAAFPPPVRCALALACLEEGQRAKAEARANHATRDQITALAQAKLAFVLRILELCAQHQTRAFASIVECGAPRSARDFLRKDYSYLFERLFYFLEDQPPWHQGIVIFDELEKSKSHILVDQMSRYFGGTATGKLRASRILPEPMFVHSDLTSLVQVADILAYVIAWGVRLPSMEKPAREELAGIADAVRALRYHAQIERDGAPFNVWSFKVIDDLRPSAERFPSTP